MPDHPLIDDRSPGMTYLHQTLDGLRRSSPAQPDFYQATDEILRSLKPLLDAEPRYLEQAIIERLVEPERQIMFRVCWTDDAGKVQVNKGYRIQFNSALGPYKGGLRFHPSVNAGIIKFLGFEQIFKNALTGLAMGGAKGGSDFDPKDKSDGEVMRFCQAFMTELYRHIGPTVDVPAGDIGVGAREIGYLYGQYKRLTHHYEGALTGKGLLWGGSLARTEATGYGTVYFARHLLRDRGEDIEGKTCLVSGAGNVALYTIEKLYQLGAKPVTCSDSGGTIYQPMGINLEVLKQIKEVERGRLTDYAERVHDAQYIPRSEYPVDGHAVWRFDADCAFPGATQNEVTEADARALVTNGVTCVAEGSNMGSTSGAVEVFLDAKIGYGPGKAANAGGVAVSGLEMAQNAGMTKWSFADVDAKLHGVMEGIYRECKETAERYGQPGNFVMGANIAGFRKVADAMLQQGVY
ncbi:MAG TPA: NADP-specific glutamate dehydrogenase [Rhodanobacteraceae bacterium]|nr:NADP-specific glutamate dehydrogenase [Rhodanobacteraceae bacterium]